MAHETFPLSSELIRQGQFIVDADGNVGCITASRTADFFDPSGGAKTTMKVFTVDYTDGHQCQFRENDIAEFGMKGVIRM